MKHGTGFLLLAARCLLPLQRLVCENAEEVKPIRNSRARPSWYCGGLRSLISFYMTTLSMIASGLRW